MALFRRNKSLLTHVISNTSRRHFCVGIQSSTYPFAKRAGVTQQLLHGSPCDYICCETHINELQSPALLINLDTVEQNCRNMEAIAAKHNVNLRAHVKTHKTLEIAEMQLRDQTEKRIEVSTIPEAFYFADKGFDDILYGLIMSQSKFNQIEQIAALQSPNTISVMTDSFHLTSQMIQYAKYNSKTNNFKFNVFIKVDSGTQRTGFDITNTRTQTQKNELLETVKLIKNNSKYCNLIGLYQYSNNCYTIGHEQMQKVFENERKILMNTIAEITNECDIEIPIISSGSTPACMAVDNFEGINEIHPGNYVFFDRMQYEFGIVDDLESIPISVMSRIIGIYPHRNEIVIDCGNVGISLDKNHESEPDIGYGSIKNYPNLKLYKLSQEVGKITTIDGRDINFNDDGLQYGGILQLIPHHSCLMACQHPFYYIVNDNDTVIDVYHKVSGW